MTKLLIIYHSQSGNTQTMAQAIYKGAVSSGATVRLKKANETTSDDLIDCDAVIFGTPNYFNYMAGTIKDLFDRSFDRIRHNVTNKPYALFGSHGRGKDKAMDSITTLCDHLNMKKAAENIGAMHQPSPDILLKCQELGGKMARL